MTAFLVAATALHLGFQLVVTALVYPVLLAGPSAGERGRHERDRWSAAHAAHARRVTPVVALVYGLLAVACAAVLVAGPRTPAELTAVGSVGAVVVVTAALAAPAHGRLAREGPSPVVVQRLRRADAARLVGAVAAAVAALVAALPAAA